MRTADRIIAHGVEAVPPNKLSEEDRRATAALRNKLRVMPVFEATNVAQYVAEHPMTMGDLPCEAPPYEQFWVEYSNFTGNERRGVFVADVTELSMLPNRWYGQDSLRAKVAKGLFPGRSMSEMKWLVAYEVFMHGKATPVYGPWYSLVVGLDSNGHQIANRWVIIASDAVDSAIAKHGAPGETPESWMLSAVAPAMQTVAFLHCRNVATDEHEAPRKLSKSHARRHGAPMVKWQTVRLEVPRRQRSSGGDGTGESPSLHIVAGHFAHYGDCCPGAHEPHGMLFGRHTGIYWSPSTIRGNPQRGITLTARDIAPVT
jgi:hypothetical protein